MRIEYIANAGFVFQFGDGRTLLSDPWFNGPAGTWYPFPPVAAAEQERLAGLRPDFIYISHLHGDHLHPPTLRHYPRDTPILIGAMRTPHLRRALESLGFTAVRPLAFGADHALGGGVRVRLFPDFSGSSAGHARAVDVDLDTSIWIEDADGTTVFNAVDNTITPAHAAAVAAACGRPKVAILQYAGASLYPMAMVGYDPARKAAERERLKLRFAARFCELADALGAIRVIPAAGEYVLGAEAAPLSRHLPHPTFPELARLCIAAGLAPDRLCKLYQGDRLDTGSLAVTRNPGALYRDFTEGERTAYAAGLAGVVTIPAHPAAGADAWADDLAAAAAAFHRTRAQHGYHAAADVVIAIGVGPDGKTIAGEPVLEVRIPLDPDADGFVFGGAVEGRALTRFHLRHGLLAAIFRREISWNGGESGGLIGLERDPDVYDPGLHQLMNAFLPGRR